MEKLIFKPLELSKFDKEFIDSRLKLQDEIVALMAVPSELIVKQGPSLELARRTREYLFGNSD